MGIKGTNLRSMREAGGAGRSPSSAGFGERTRLIGGRPREGMTGHRAAAGRPARGAFGRPRISLKVKDEGPMTNDLFVTTTSQRSPFQGSAFRQIAENRPDSHPVATVQTTAAHTCELTITKNKALVAVANSAVVMAWAEFAAAEG